MTGAEQTIITLRWDSRLPSKTTCDVAMLYPFGELLLYKHDHYRAGEILIGGVIHYRYILGGCDFDVLEIRDTIENKDYAKNVLNEAIANLK